MEKEKRDCPKENEEAAKDEKEETVGNSATGSPAIEIPEGKVIGEFGY